jgi:UDP-glucose 4-epimerase
MILVLTGSHGFIGSHLRLVLEDKRKKFIHIDLKNGRDLGKRGTFDWLKNKIENCGDDVVILHLAALVDARESLEEPARYFGNNLAATWHVAQLGALENVRRIVFTSSAAVYGEPEYLPIDVNHPTRPKSPYGLSKLYEEQLLHQFSEEYGYSLVVLRLFNVYGEHQKKGLFGALIQAVRDGKTFTIYGDGNQVRDYIYVGDVANAILSFAKNKREGIFNVASGVGITVNQIIEWATERYPLNVVHDNPIPGEIRESIGKPDVKLPEITKERVWSVIEKSLKS